MNRDQSQVVFCTSNLDDFFFCPPNTPFHYHPSLVATTEVTILGESQQPKKPQGWTNLNDGRGKKSGAIDCCYLTVCGSGGLFGVKTNNQVVTNMRKKNHFF